MNILIILVFLILVAVCTALFFLNLGSPKIISTVLLGLTSFLISTVFVLKSESRTRVFITSIAIKEDGSPVVIGTFPRNLVEDRQANLAGVFAHAHNKNFTEGDIMDGLQYLILTSDLWKIGKFSESAGYVDRGDGIKEARADYVYGMDSVEFPNFTPFQYKIFDKILSENQYYRDTKEYVNSKEIILPEGARMNLTIDNEIRTIRIWKPAFFEVTIGIKQVSMNTDGPNIVPQGFRIAKEQVQGIKTKSFKIVLYSKFSPWSSEHSSVVANKKWVGNIFDTLEKRYSNVNNGEFTPD